MPGFQVPGFRFARTVPGFQVLRTARSVPGFQVPGFRFAGMVPGFGLIGAALRRGLRERCHVSLGLREWGERCQVSQ
ncbi:MAG TPA: hypothetical protein PK025_09220 [Spirochaetales bacterium]|nr:hypothetical protein [Spirochaetales bacterium]